jgi:hypothetical protein
MEQILECLLAKMRRPPSKNGCHSKGNERNDGKAGSQDTEQPRKDGIPSQKYDGQNGLPARQNVGLSRKDRGHGFGDKSRRNRV